MADNHEVDKKEKINKESTEKEKLKHQIKDEKNKIKKILGEKKRSSARQCFQLHLRSLRNRRIQAPQIKT